MRVFSGPSIHSLDQPRPPILPIHLTYSAIRLFTRPSVHPSSLPACSCPVHRPTDRQQWPVVGRTSRYRRMQQGSLECCTVCGFQSTGVRIRASLWSLRVPMIYCKHVGRNPLFSLGWGALGRPLLTTVLLTRAIAAPPPEKKNRSEQGLAGARSVGCDRNRPVSPAREVAAQLDASLLFQTNDNGA